MEGTEEILRAACCHQYTNINDDDLGPRFKIKEGAVPWALYLDFETKKVFPFWELEQERKDHANLMILW